ncbi:glycosyltransferase family 4 protein [Spirulina sp. CS-785/01]|uniref:glycosyltransferase family 4 protein n=1 Tax=Spirulina sp. CS-785/01 TaxID=3021716 RepID=UPI00232D94C8|nr:glycosyltransferase family 4 protein [Spirulina sp. CS-785/01]MDB9315532.1 glycosyltransferase family 4 protein [Spirulina sp. CS-785/01]
MQNFGQENLQHQAPIFLLFDLSIYGHHPAYIQHLIEYWEQQQFSGHLAIVVSPQFLEVHGEVVQFAQGLKSQNIQFYPITLEEKNALKSRDSALSRNWRNIQEWLLFCRYAKALQATQGMILYLDTYLLGLALGLRSPIPFSGIYFRPTFHYPTFSHYQGRSKDQLQFWREKFILSRVLKQKRFKHLLSLDPFAVAVTNQIFNTQKARTLADPIRINAEVKLSPQALKEQFNIDNQRTIFLLFGALTSRKGVDRLLDSIQFLSPESCEEITLILSGEANPKKQEQLKLQVQQLRVEKPIQILENYQFLPENEIFSYFNLADIVLAPYQRHVGMSGILLWAAVAGKPVLSSDYGLMGELVEQYQLGITVDSTQSRAIAQGIEHCLQEQILSDQQKMQAFAQANAAEEFARTIFRAMMQP